MLTAACHMQINIRNYKITLRIIHQVFKTTEVQKHTKIEAYKVLASQMFSYARIVWTIRKQDERRLSDEIKFLRKAAAF